MERRLAANSIEGYARDLNQLMAFALSRSRDIRTLDRVDIEAFVRSQMAEGRSPRSVARTVAGVRGFYKYLVVDGRLTASPAADVRPPRAWKTLPKYLSLDDVDTLLTQPDTTTPRGLRDRALIELLYATGLRVSELVGLKPNDVNLEASLVTCLGKGGKERVVPIGDEAGAWVQRYLASARPQLLKRRSSSRLFVNARGGGPGLTRMGFWKILAGLRPPGGAAILAEPARAAPFVCDAPARARRRPALDPADAGARGPLHDANLHARPRAPPAQRLRLVPSARLSSPVKYS